MTPSEPGRTAGSSGSRLALIFFFQAFAAGSFLTRIPDIQRNLGIEADVLGLALLGQSLGGLIFFFFASSLVERFGTRMVMLLGVPVLALSIALATVAPGPATVFAILFCNGAVFAITNLAMNVEADRIEAASGERVMNRCHGLGSLGLLVVSLIGAAARGAGISPMLHLSALLPVVGLATLLLVLPLRPSPPRPHTAQGRRRIFVRPSRMTFLLVGFVLAGFLLEGTARTWSIIYMRDSFAVPEWLQSLALPAFLVSMSGGRLFGDRWTARFGPTRVARALLLVGMAGLLLVAAAPNVFGALFGFVLMGLGSSVIYPLTISAAARIGDRPSSENVAAVTMIGAFVVLGVPAAMGFVAASLGIRMVFAVIVPLLLVSLLLARFLEPAPPPPRP